MILNSLAKNQWKANARMDFTRMETSALSVILFALLVQGSRVFALRAPRISSM